ncbi:MAG: extracellular solute-binding protein [Firmicutes bacterium]|nr:extracellular solute-binding protein [Bacillota bacterium]
MGRRHKAYLVLAFVLVLLISACTQKTGLNPKSPVTLSLWHNFGGQMQTTMDAQLQEFNATVGKEKGIIVNVTSISSSASLQEKLTMVAAGDPGAPDMPDITTCYPATASLLAKKGLLVQLEDHFTAAEPVDYLPIFLEEGRLADGQLYVFPFAKSTEVLFLNQTLFYDFAAATGVTVESLSTLEGIARAAMQYYQWTDAQTPSIPNDGGNFYTADSIFNLAQVGMGSRTHPPCTRCL